MTTRADGDAADLGRVALVTGGAGGLGAAIARALHAAGYRVAVADLDRDRAAAVAAACDGSGEAAIGIALDVRRKRDFVAARDLLKTSWGGAQILVNNAALTVARPSFDIEEDEFDAVMGVNLRGTFFGCQVFGDAFRQRRHGRIINIASLAAQNGGTATGAHYAASKGGIISLTKAFARELASHGVTVNAVAPGPLDVPLTYDIVGADRMSAMRTAIPVGELGDPGFVGAMVVQLASPEAASVTGATWDVNGGLYMR